MILNRNFHIAACRTYLEQTKTRFEVKRDEIDRYAMLHEWDSVRMAAIDLAALAEVLRDTENKLADIE